MTKIQRAAKILIRRATDGRYLVLTCSLWPENPRRSQQPDLPGGTIEPSEAIEAGLLREIREEAGLELAADTLQLGYCFTHAHGDVSTSFLLYVGEVAGDEDVTLSWEHEAYAWLTAEEILAMRIRTPYTEMFQHLHEVGLLV